MKLGQYVLSYQESKGPQRSFAAEVIHVEDNTVKIAIFHPLEEFRILTATLEGEILVGPRDTTLSLRAPNAHEKVSVAKVRERVLARLSEADRRAYDNPADSGKKRKKQETKSLVDKWTPILENPPKVPQIIESKPTPKKPAAKKKVVKKAAKRVRPGKSGTPGRKKS